MTIQQRAAFEVELHDLAVKYGLELKYTPVLSWSGEGVHAQAGSALWTLYDKSGSPTNEFMVHLRSKATESLNKEVA